MTQKLTVITTLLVFFVTLAGCNSSSEGESGRLSTRTGGKSLGNSGAGEEKAREFWRKELLSFRQRVNEFRPKLDLRNSSRAPVRPRRSIKPGSEMEWSEEDYKSYKESGQDKFGDWYRLRFLWPDRDYTEKEQMLVHGFKFEYDYNRDGQIDRESGLYSDEVIKVGLPQLHLLADLAAFHHATGRMPENLVELFAVVYPPDSLADTTQPRLDERMADYLDPVNLRLIDLQVEDPEKAKSGDVYAYAWSSEALEKLAKPEEREIWTDRQKKLWREGNAFYMRRYREGGILEVWETSILRNARISRGAVKVQDTSDQTATQRSSDASTSGTSSREESLDSSQSLPGPRKSHTMRRATMREFLSRVDIEIDGAELQIFNTWEGLNEREKELVTSRHADTIKESLENDLPFELNSAVAELRKPGEIDRASDLSDSSVRSLLPGEGFNGFTINPSKPELGDLVVKSLTPEQNREYMIAMAVALDKSAPARKRLKEAAQGSGLLVLTYGESGEFIDGTASVILAD